MQKKQSTARELILFSMPLILSGILQQLYSWADAFIVGHAEGELPLAAVGATTSISMFLINTILGLTLGLSSLGAQHYGRRDPSAVTRILSCFLPLIVLLYAVLSAAAYACASPILRLMDTPADIFAWSLDYLKIIFIGIPFLACYNLFAALLRAVGNTKAARAEEILIASLARNPDFYRKLEGKLTPDLFVTSFNKRLFGSLCEKIKSDSGLELSFFADEFNPQEMDSVTRIFHSGVELSNTLKECEDCIEVLKSCSGGEKPKASQLSDDEFLKLFKK